jgi:hypothetical protein
MSPPRTLPEWCRANGIANAIVGGFYIRATGTPLGELRTHGVRRDSEPFTHPARSCLHVEGGAPRIAPRAALPRDPRGDLLQAGPLLVRDGRPVVDDAIDPEGFSAGSAQFDSDITEGRHPRAALGLDRDCAIAVAVDGRSAEAPGMTLIELARFMAELGSEHAINLDGGGSTSLVLGGRLVNRPRDEHGAPPHRGREICTAVAFAPRQIQCASDDLAATAR